MAAKAKVPAYTLNVTAQYYENYGFHEGLVNWKPKGVVYFEVPTYCDSFFYFDKDKIDAALKTMLAKESNGLARYEFVEYVLEFEEPRVLEGFDELMLSETES